MRVINRRPLYFIFFFFTFLVYQSVPSFSQVDVELKIWGSAFDQPLDMIQGAGDDFIIIEKAGLVKKVDNDGILIGIILDVKDQIGDAGGERGLLGVALHPKYPEEPYIFLNHTDKENNTAVVRYTFPVDAVNIDPTTRKVLLSVEQPYSNHNGGNIVFGPDGYLYIGMGDGGSGGDPQNRAQNLKVLLGKILRIDVDKGDKYSIPEDNPFVDDPETRDEIWSYGWRNPWRFSFDRMTGDMWVGDVGQNKVEEISYESAEAPGGLNYGWRCYEGDQVYDQSGDCDQPFVFPVLTRTHGTGDRSITGGYRYRGPAEGFENHYIFGDFVSGKIYMAVLNESDSLSVDKLLTLDKKQSIASFAEDKEGNLFALSLNGQIYEILLSCGIPKPSIQIDQMAVGDTTIVMTDSNYVRYIWHYSENSDEKENFRAVDTTENHLFYAMKAGNYYVTVIDENGCQRDSDIVQIVLSAVSSREFYDIKLFPNPVSDYLTMDTRKSLSRVLIEMYSMNGKLIRHLYSSLPGKLPVHDLANGMYLLKFQVDGKNYLTKIIKE